MSSNNNYEEDNADALRKILPLFPEDVDYTSDRMAKYKAPTDPSTFQLLLIKKIIRKNPPLLRKMKIPMSLDTID